MLGFFKNAGAGFGIGKIGIFPFPALLEEKSRSGKMRENPTFSPGPPITIQDWMGFFAGMYCVCQIYFTLSNQSNFCLTKNQTDFLHFICSYNSNTEFILKCQKYCVFESESLFLNIASLIDWFKFTHRNYR